MVAALHVDLETKALREHEDAACREAVSKHQQDMQNPEILKEIASLKDAHKQSMMPSVLNCWRKTESHESEFIEEKAIQTGMMLYHDLNEQDERDRMDITLALNLTFHISKLAWFSILMGALFTTTKRTVETTTKYSRQLTEGATSTIHAAANVGRSGCWSGFVRCIRSAFIWWLSRAANSCCNIRTASYRGGAQGRHRRYLEKQLTEYLKMSVKLGGPEVKEGDVFRAIRQYSKLDIPLDKLDARMQHHADAYHFILGSHWLKRPVLLVFRLAKRVFTTVFTCGLYSGRQKVREPVGTTDRQVTPVHSPLARILPGVSLYLCPQYSSLAVVYHMLA